MSPVLGYPISGLGYRLYTNASDHGIGAVLQQVQPIRVKDLRGTKTYIRLKDAFDSKKPLPCYVSRFPVAIILWPYVRNSSLEPRQTLQPITSGSR